MSSETHDPVLGPPRSDASPSGPLEPAASPPANEVGKRPSISPLPTSTSSGDELSALLTDSIIHPEPDPFLGEFSTEERPDAEPTPNAKANPEPDGPSAPPEVPADSVPGRQESNSDVFPLDLTDESAPEVPESSATAGSFDALSALASITGLSPSDAPATESGRKGGASARARSTARTPAAAGDGDFEEEDEEEDDEPSSRRSSWLTLLLVSYASAVTLGLLWVLMTGRKLREGEEIDLFPAANRLDPGRRADQSRKVVPPEPLPADHVARLGQAIRLGSLEATPLEIGLGHVDLEGTFDELEHEDGGPGALRLKLKLKNVSSDTIFVPLDEAFLRERVVGKPDSFIETAKGGQIAMYPLAVASEWSIRGQTFKELQPGESYDTELVSATEVSDRLSPEMTWRIRLRTGLDRTDTLGVRFRRDEVRPGS